MKKSIVLNNSLCEHIADLAKLNINEEEKESILKDMNDIVSFVSKLEEAVSSLDETTILPLSKTHMREDIPKKSFARDKLLSASTSVQDGYITVPNVIEA